MCHASGLHVHLAPAFAEVFAHAGENEEEQRLIHLVHRTEDFLDVRGAIRLRAAVSEVEGINDFAVVSGCDARLTKQRHHAREALDVFLHHDWRDGDACIVGQAELAAQGFGDLRVVCLRPDTEEVFGKRSPSTGAAFADLDDAFGSLVKVGTREDEARHGDIHAITRTGRQGGGPFA